MKNKETLDELMQRRDAHIKRYIGVWAKPASYYTTLSSLNKQIENYG